VKRVEFHGQTTLPMILQRNNQSNTRNAFKSLFFCFKSKL